MYFALESVQTFVILSKNVPQKKNMNNNPIENGSSNSAFLRDNELPQEDFLQIILHHRWIILCTVVLFLIAAFLYLLKATPIYISTSRLYIEQTGPKIINEYEGIMTHSKNYLYTQGELIKSTPIIAVVVDDARIKQFGMFTGIDNLVTYVKSNLNVAIGKKNDIITVSFDSAYPEEAAQIVNAVVDSYIGYHSTRKRSTVSQVLNILQKEKIKRDRELTKKFDKMLKFTQENGMISFDKEGEHIVFKRLAKLSSVLTELQMATVNAKTDFEAIKTMADEPAKIKQFATAQPDSGIRIFVNDIESQLLTELKNSEVELKNARYYCTENHPAIYAIHTKINYIRKQLDEQASKFAEAYTKTMELRWITAKQRENELKAALDEQFQAARDLEIKVAEYSVIRSELERTERLCEILDNRIKELNVTEDVGALNISILEVARPADRPSKPQKTKIMLIALIFGLMSGSALALLRDWLDYRLRSVEEISAVLSIPVLGVVPTMLEEQNIINRSQKLWLDFKTPAVEICRVIHAVILSIISGEKVKTIELTSASTGSDETVLKKQTIINRGQKVHLKPKSIVAEAYRTIRTAVFFGVPKGEAKSIVITSPAPGDGKSTLASNMAITMAQAGQKTLILDADFRKPMQHNIFGISNEKGLSCALAGDIALEQAIRHSEVEGLDILTCGQEVPNPSEILNSDAFAEILKKLSECYDRIIVDSPPVAPVADSQILSAICDVTILVVRAEKSTRKLSQRACESLISVGGNLLGVVVNDILRKHGRYGYSSYGYAGYGYYNSDSYGYEEKEKQDKSKKVYT